MSVVVPCCLSLLTDVGHCLLLPVIACHCLPLLAVACCCLSLLAVACRCRLMPVISCRCPWLSLAVLPFVFVVHRGCKGSRGVLRASSWLCWFRFLFPFWSCLARLACLACHSCPACLACLSCLACLACLPSVACLYIKAGVPRVWVRHATTCFLNRVVCFSSSPRTVA